MLTAANHTSGECNATMSNDMILEELKSSLKTQTCKVEPFVWNSNVSLQKEFILNILK